MKPTPISIPPPLEPAGNWLSRSLAAMLREHRLPTAAAVAWDRLLIAIGRRTKRIHSDGLRIVIRRLAADEHFVREVILDRQYTPPGYEINESDTVIDVGGNIGSFALLAGQAAWRGKVVSLEPVAANFELLERNVRLNGLDNVIPVRAAVANRRGQAAVYLSPQGSGHHSTIAELAGTAEHYEVVDALSLDDVFAKYRIRHCDFLKLDCEGAEFAILSATPAERMHTIGKLAIEYHTLSIDRKHEQAGELVAQLGRLGYCVDTYTDILGTNRGMIFARRQA